MIGKCISCRKRNENYHVIVCDAYIIPADKCRSDMQKCLYNCYFPLSTMNSNALMNSIQTTSQPINGLFNGIIEAQT